MAFEVLFAVASVSLFIGHATFRQFREYWIWIDRLEALSERS